MNIDYQLTQSGHARWKVAAQTAEDAGHLAQKMTVEGFRCTDVTQQQGAYPFIFEVEGEVALIEPLLLHTAAEKS